MSEENRYINIKDFEHLKDAAISISEEDGSYFPYAFKDASGEWSCQWDCVNDLVKNYSIPANMLTDGYHTFEDLYFQRLMLFAVLVNTYGGWKSRKNDEGIEDPGWFIVGIDTPEGSYTYHYQSRYWELFNCEELPKAKHWDGHTSKDVTRLLSLVDDKEKK